MLTHEACLTIEETKQYWCFRYVAPKQFYTENTEQFSFKGKESLTFTQEIIVLKINLNLMIFVNSNSEVRCWHENMLAQRGQRTTCWHSFLADFLGKRTSLLPSKTTKKKKKNQKLPKFKVLPYYLLAISLSMFLTLKLPIVTSCQLIAGSTTWPKVASWPNTGFI